MDERLSKALEFSNFRVSLFNKKENIRLKMDSICSYAVNGGIFKADPQTITFVKLVLDSGRDGVVLIDVNGNPIEITDIRSLYEELTSRYFQATNFYYVEYDKIKKARSVKSLFPELFDEESK
jgi:hypothetical protein